MSSQRLLIIGAVLGVVTAVLLLTYVGQIRSQQTVVQVLQLKPSVALAKGDLVTADMVESVGLPENFKGLLARALSAGPETGAWIKDRPVTRDVEAGSLLLYEHFEDTPDTRFAATIEPGMRAISIPVETATAVSFFVEPGSRVDVLATMLEGGGLLTSAQYAQAAQRNQPGGGQIPAPEARQVATKTLLQNVRVLAIGSATTRGAYLGEVGERFETVTIEVTPLQAEKIVFALEHTEPRRELTLVLRNPTDDAEVNLPSVSWTALDSIK